jgi:hypothetical protein
MHMRARAHTHIQIYQIDTKFLAWAASACVAPEFVWECQLHQHLTQELETATPAGVTGH